MSSVVSAISASFACSSERSSDSLSQSSTASRAYPHGCVCRRRRRADTHTQRERERRARSGSLSLSLSSGSSRGGSDRAASRLGEERGCVCARTSMTARSNSGSTALLASASSSPSTLCPRTSPTLRQRETLMRHAHHLQGVHIIIDLHTYHSYLGAARSRVVGAEQPACRFFLLFFFLYSCRICGGARARREIYIYPSSWRRAQRLEGRTIRLWARVRVSERRVRLVDGGRERLRALALLLGSDCELVRVQSTRGEKNLGLSLSRFRGGVSQFTPRSGAPARSPPLQRAQSLVERGTLDDDARPVETEHPRAHVQGRRVSTREREGGDDSKNPITRGRGRELLRKKPCAERCTHRSY